ncbi:unnamed protein product [Amoebophrya sp. A120]|nr:unnamed protein product [Amoebophrya sp. A120]|eukprot:GSA120T00005339001.1
MVKKGALKKKNRGKIAKDVKKLSKNKKKTRAASDDDVAQDEGEHTDATASKTTGETTSTPSCTTSRPQPTSGRTPSSSTSAKPSTKGQKLKLYEVGDLILVVGDGDLSFSTSLLKKFGAGNVFLQPTVYDSRKELTKKYPDTVPNLLKQLSSNFKAVPRYNVDARALLETGDKKWEEFFTKIVFNFPHCGEEAVEKTLAEQDASTTAQPAAGGCKNSIEQHQELLLDFLKSAAKCLDQNGEIHIAVKRGEPYKHWKVASLGKVANLRLDRQVPFVPLQGYHHRRTNGLQYEKGRGFNSENIQNNAQVYVFQKRQGEAGAESAGLHEDV